MFGLTGRCMMWGGACWGSGRGWPLISPGSQPASSSSSETRDGDNSRRPPEMPVHEMSSRRYWDALYEGQNLAGFDWLLSYHNLQQDLSVLLPSHPYRLLDMGCGTSPLTPLLYQTSQTPITACCLDFSYKSLCLLQQFVHKAAAPACPHSRIYFTLADVLKLPFPDKSFDVILDKGTTDSLLKDDKEPIPMATAMLAEALRVLTSGGQIMQVTDEDPDLRTDLLSSSGKALGHSDLSVVHRSVVGDSDRDFFLYIIKPT